MLSGVTVSDGIMNNAETRSWSLFCL